jgi:site-specific DNA recombinase
MQAVAKQGGDWCTVEGQYDSSSAMGGFILRIVADIAQLEREQIAERTTAALLAKKARGERLGTTPLGYKTIDTLTGKKVIQDVEEQKTVQLARDLRAKGVTFRGIADHLTAAGCKTKNGGQWRSGTVYKIVYDRYLEEIGV